MIIPTTVAEDIQIDAIKSGRPEEFLAGVIVAYQIAGIEIRNLTNFLEESTTINFRRVKEILDEIKENKKKYP